MWEMMMVWTRLIVVEMEKRGRRSSQQDLAVGWMQEKISGLYNQAGDNAHL